MAGNDQFDGMGTMGAEMRCSFCGKTRSQVSKLIAGPGGVYRTSSPRRGASPSRTSPRRTRSTTSSPSTSWARRAPSAP